MWLGKGLVKAIQSFIVEHIVDIDRTVKIDRAFLVYDRIPRKLPQSRINKDHDHHRHHHHHRHPQLHTMDHGNALLPSNHGMPIRLVL